MHASDILTEMRFLCSVLDLLSLRVWGVYMASAVRLHVLLRLGCASMAPPSAAACGISVTMSPWAETDE